MTSKKWSSSESREVLLKLSTVLRGCGLSLASSLLLLGASAHADGAAYDLAGPAIEVKVTRAGKTLPIAEVPNLQAGDRLWLHPEVPASHRCTTC
jgi:hypothetical protein